MPAKMASAEAAGMSARRRVISISCSVVALSVAVHLRQTSGLLITQRCLESVTATDLPSKAGPVRWRGTGRGREMPGGGRGARSQQAQAGFTEQIGGVVQARPCRPSCVSSLLRPDSAASRPWQATTKQLGAEGCLKALAFTGLDPYVMRASIKSRTMA